MPFRDVPKGHPHKRRGKDSVPGARRSPFVWIRNREQHAMPVLDNDRSLHFAGRCCGPPLQHHASLRAVIQIANCGPQDAPSRHRVLASCLTTTIFPPMDPRGGKMVFMKGVTMETRGIYITAPDGTVICELQYDARLRNRQRWYKPWYPYPKRPGDPTTPSNIRCNPNNPRSKCSS